MRRKDFNPKGKFEAKKAFSVGGRHFEMGASIPWRNMSLSARRLRLLYNANWIRHPAEEGDAPVPSVRPYQPEVTEDKTVEVTEGE